MHGEVFSADRKFRYDLGKWKEQECSYFYAKKERKTLWQNKLCLPSGSYSDGDLER